MNKQETEAFLSGAYTHIVQLIKLRFEEDLSNVVFGFDEVQKGCIAEYRHLDNSIRFKKLEENVQYNDKTELLEVLIHELAHAICDRYDLCNSLLDGCHNFSFALVNYCLQRTLIGRRFGMFRLYDVQDETNIEKLDLIKFGIKFERVARQIEFDTIKELTKESHRCAEYMRKNILKTTTHAEWYN